MRDLAILVAEDDSGAYEPVAVIGSLGEAVTIACDDFAQRMMRVEAGHDALCPAHYLLWTRDPEGSYRITEHVNPDGTIHHGPRWTGGTP